MSRRTWTLFAAVSLVWGLPYLLVKIAVDDGVPNATIAWVRVALAAVVLMPVAWRAGALRGAVRRPGAIAAYAALEIVLPFTLINFGLERVTSSFAAILIAAVPLGVAVLALRLDREERVGGVRLVGLLVGLGGVMLLLGVDVAGDPGELVGAVAILVATLGYAAGPLVIKHHLKDVAPLGAVAAAMLVASLAFAPAALITAPSKVPGGDAIAALIAAGVLCTALGFVLYYVLVGAAGPSRASLITYVNPVVAVALGVTFLEEPVTAAAIAGLLLVLAGSYLASGGGLPRGPFRAAHASAGSAAELAGCAHGDGRVKPWTRTRTRTRRPSPAR